MAITLANASAQAAADGVVDRLDAGSGSGTLDIRSGTRPASPDDTATGTLLATLTFSDPAFGSTTTAGVATANSISSGTGLAADTATWARAKDSSGNAVFDASVGTSNADILLTTTAITVGATVAVSSMTYTQPDGT